MRVAVIGGTGLIGWHAARALRERGHEVRIIARREPPEALGLGGCEFASIDLYASTPRELRDALQGCDGLVQAAGADPRIVPSGSATEFFFQANVESNLTLFSAALEAGVTAGVILTSYFHPLRPEMADHPYVASRIASEERLMELCDDALRLVILQPPYVFGAIPGRTSLGDSLTQAARFPLLVPRGGTNAMSVMALSQAICGAIERSSARGTYLVGDENLTWRALIGRFGGRAGILPTWILRSVMALGRVALYLLRRQAGLNPVDLTDVIASEMFFDPGPGQEALGYSGGDLDEAISDLRG
ncbi:MAG: epimerase [Deltaproteobacteria bacterium]|nr:epimerase [Deltaproteobacteria bacterium]